MSSAAQKTAPLAPAALAAPVPRILLDAQEAAAALGIGTTLLYEGVAQGWLPKPRQMGTRGSRWLPAELAAAAAALPLADNPPAPGRRKRSAGQAIAGG